jgi:hypothetical protein
MHKYVKIGKEMEKGKRKGFPLLAGPGGIRPSRGGAAARAGGLLGPPAEGMARGRRRGRGPTCQRGGEGTVLRGVMGGRTGRSSTAGEAPVGSPSGSRFCVDGVVARHGRG